MCKSIKFVLDKNADPPQIYIPSANPEKIDEITDWDFKPWMSDFNAQKHFDFSTLYSMT